MARMDRQYQSTDFGIKDLSLYMHLTIQCSLLRLHFPEVLFLIRRYPNHRRSNYSVQFPQHLVYGQQILIKSIKKVKVAPKLDYYLVSYPLAGPGV